MNNTRVFFLKVNRYKNENIKCIKNWIDICSELNGKIIIVCDKHEIREIIKRDRELRDYSFSFCRSKTIRLYRIVKNLYSGKWKNATYAHVYPFYYSEKRGIKCHWDIDADDISICLKKDKIIKMIQNVERMADNKEIDLYSIDIWHSRTKGKHWSFGVVYSHNNSRIYNNICSIKNTQWMDEMKDIDESYNIDWFCTYLRNQGAITARTFYIKNAILIHWGEFIAHPLYSTIIQWKSEYTYFPILNDILLSKAGKVKICDMDEIDIEVEEGESAMYIREVITDLSIISNKRRILYGIEL